ncbi:periplasmic ATP/GTP-binding protein [Minicystis rosea]|nr:periplasmic ATP/GTP-binding protein [Minicystis rosea]
MTSNRTVLSSLLIASSLLAVPGCIAGDVDDPTTIAAAEAPLSHDDDCCAAFPRTVSGFDTPESAYWDEGTDAWYVTNMAGSPIEKDGVGWISKLDRCGNIVNAKWVSGLNAPKGIRIANGKLYTSDMDELVVVDLATKAVTKIPAPGAILLNDPSVGPDGSVYAPDTFGNTIWRFKNGQASIFVSSPLLDLPNGSIVKGNDLIIASTGALVPPITQGKVWKIDLHTKAMTQYGTFEAKMDGIERYKNGYLIGDSTTVYFVTANGSSVVHDFTADGLDAINDIGLDPERKLLAVPAYLNHTVTFYPLRKQL